MDDDDAQRAVAKRQALVSLQGVEEALADERYDTARERWEHLGERLTELVEMENENDD